MSSPALPRRRSTPRPVNVAEPSIPSPAPAPADEGRRSAGARLAGRFRHDVRGSTWWSPEMFAVLGLPPDAVPSAGLLVRTADREDRTRLLDALNDAAAIALPFCLEVRMEREGEPRSIVVIGEPHLDAGGTVNAVEGICVDVTDGRPQGPNSDRLHALQAEVGQLRTAMASRAAIEQAKGILMLLTSCGDQVAFDLLAHISSHTHRKVRDVAHVLTESAAGRAKLPDDVRAILRDACPPTPPMH